MQKSKGSLRVTRFFIRVDGCHLKENYGKVLLSVVSMDANSGIFPITFAFVELENEEN